jgi:hypothetical protein
MVHHVRLLVEEFLAGRGTLSGPILAMELATELSALRTSDFEAGARADFVNARGMIRRVATWASNSEEAYQRAFAPILPVLDGYRGEGSGGTVRLFPYVHQTSLRRIIERDYLELTVKLFPAGAWKSTVVLAGSILEAILLDLLSDANRAPSAEANPKGPRKPMSSGDWKLVQLIAVAVDLGLLPASSAASIDEVLRNYRNFVHPRLELRENRQLGEAKALLALGALKDVCDHFDRTLGGAP